MTVPSELSCSSQQSIFITQGHAELRLSHQKHRHRVAWLDTPERLLDVSRKWFLKINLQLCILTCHRGEAPSLLSMRVMKHCPVKYKCSICFLVPQRCFHAGEAHSLETSGNTSHTVSVPEAPTLLSVFVFLIKLDIVLFFLMFGWWWFFSFAVSVVLWVWAVCFFSFVLRHLGVLFLYFFCSFPLLNFSASLATVLWQRYPDWSKHLLLFCFFFFPYFTSINLPFCCTSFFPLHINFLYGGKKYFGGAFSFLIVAESAAQKKPISTE